MRVFKTSNTNGDLHAVAIKFHEFTNGTEYVEKQSILKFTNQEEADKVFDILKTFEAEATTTPVWDVAVFPRQTTSGESNVRI